MILIRKTVILLLVICSLWSCSKDQAQPYESLNDHALIYQELLRMEYALLTEDYDQLNHHSNNLDDILRGGYNLFCPNESAQIDGARMTNHILAQHINTKETYHLLDDLRILKGTIIHLETDDDYDPYFAYLWQFEEDMFTATQIAMDPMLDLYEWNEFNAIVACTEESWQRLKLHFPSPEIFNNDPARFKLQSIFKIYLENALDDFNLAVTSANYEEYPLCESAEKLQKAYTDYIKTFVVSSKINEPFLAKL